MCSATSTANVEKVNWPLTAPSRMDNAHSIVGILHSLSLRSAQHDQHDHHSA